MEPFIKHTGVVAILDRGNIDTDQIISKEFLKSIRRTGFGDQLFHHWRHQADGTLDPDFELNHPAFKDASILITGNNFGCGSSREHAVWAITQYGFRAILAPRKKVGSDLIPGFADIFKGNSTKNGLLLLEFDEKEINEMRDLVNKQKGIKATIDLPGQTIIFDGNKTWKFDIEPARKTKFIEALDDIGQTERFLATILNFEKTHSPQLG